ncbi:hypothetical protein [Bacteroides sp. 224]|uniref:hypothetical protein n=1 Tax=Bacteroides sp. 224 TaxID=2302936 RepID=UPI0013D6F0C2|nr:hypothetical protein [Bacteroides sp. 224]NDV64606.1 hypothetical protein [Bacteroides sp. 224]
MMKKILIIVLSLLLSSSKLWSCGWDEEEYYSYYSLIFSQELINDSRYYPFLLDFYLPYYETDETKFGNIEEWSTYLHIPYEQAYYLVFKASEENVLRLLANKNVEDEQLKFADRNFVSMHTEALQYLLTAKELEPYMTISGAFSNDWSYYEDSETDIDKLPYNQINLKLQKAWKQAKNKEIKLRYGYQLVRFAHYNKRYQEAVDLFDLYVEPLNLKSEMYYYALSQKAGAIRGLGDVITANSLFFQVFSYSIDLKTTALSSMKLNENVDYESFLMRAKTIEEKNDADLLLGYISFSNPLASARKIAKRSPDAIQAKVLTARAISFIESDIEKYGEVSGYKDRRFPIVNKDEIRNMQDVLTFVKTQAVSNKVNQKNYWNITTAYLLYLDRKYAEANAYLQKVDVSEEGYQLQKDILAMLIDLGREPIINREVEKRLYAEYNDVFMNRSSSEGRSKVAAYVIDLLSNRYYLQKDYAKSFMLQNSLIELQGNPNLDLLIEIENLYNKPNKNTFEEYLVNEFKVGIRTANNEEKISVTDYIKYMKGVIYLANDDLEMAKQMFETNRYLSNSISSDVFGYNRIECFECKDNMAIDYLSEFDYIDDNISEGELVYILMQLKEEALKNDSRSAKANYLLGNFFYNVSATGYYRNYVRFGYASNSQWFFDTKDKNRLFKDQISLKDIPSYFDNSVEIANNYLQTAYQFASDNELKARIVFALSKCEQGMHYQKLFDKYQADEYWWSGRDEDWVMISNRKYFEELMKYKNTRFFKEVETNCKYFEYYVSCL